VLSGTSHCDELIARPEESYRLWCVCDRESSITGTSLAHWGCRAILKKYTTLRWIIVKYTGNQKLEMLGFHNKVIKILPYSKVLKSKYRVIHKSVKHFTNSQQINHSTDHGSSHGDRERNSPSFLHISQMLNVSTTKTCEGITIETCHKGGQDAQQKKTTR